MLGQRVVALSEIDVSHHSLGVDELLGRPVLVGVRVPRAVAVVDGDRVLDAERRGRGHHVPDDVLEGEHGVWTPTTTRPSGA